MFYYLLYNLFMSENIYMVELMLLSALSSSHKKLVNVIVQS